MAIKIKPPVEGKREKITKGDEAEVSRLFCTKEKKYEGLVERFQRFPSFKDPRFFLSLGGRRKPRTDFLFYPTSLNCHILRYVAMNLSKEFFPDNFLDSRELRLSTSLNGRSIAATYSPFVPDESGVIERWKRVRIDIDHAVAHARGQDFFLGPLLAQQALREVVNKANAHENKLNPQLQNLPNLMQESGIHLAHPQANYHVFSGNTVFMEAGGIDLVLIAKKAASLKGKKREDVLGKISALYAMLLLYGSGSKRGNSDTEEVSHFEKLAFTRHSSHKNRFLTDVAFCSRRVFDVIFSHLLKFSQLPKPREVYRDCVLGFFEGRSTAQTSNIRRRSDMRNIIRTEMMMGW